jgi:hypothetical protein
MAIVRKAIAFVSLTITFVTVTIAIVTLTFAIVSLKSRSFSRFRPCFFRKGQCLWAFHVDRGHYELYTKTEYTDDAEFYQNEAKHDFSFPHCHSHR